MIYVPAHTNRIGEARASHPAGSRLRQHGPNRAEVGDIMLKNKIVADRDLLDRMDWQASSPDGEFNLDSVDSVQSFFKQEAINDKTAPRERRVDASFAQAAAKELAPFQLLNKSSTLQGCR